MRGLLYTLVCTDGTPYLARIEGRVVVCALWYGQDHTICGSCDSRHRGLEAHQRGISQEQGGTINNPPPSHQSMKGLYLGKLGIVGKMGKLH